MDIKNIDLLCRILTGDKVVDEFFHQYKSNSSFKKWLDELIPEVSKANEMEQNNPWHIYNVLTHILHSVEEMNKLGILFLNKGVYNGKRIVSEKYVEMCSKTQIKTPTGHWGDYSFQFWMIPEGDGYRADGAFGQYTFIWPKYDLALSIQRPEDDKNGVMLEILKEEVLSKLK